MNIGGFQKTSLIDYPGKISCILFLSGCNFDCPYCHNPDLVRGNKAQPALDEQQLKDFLSKRQGLLDGVVVTGGEPTLQPDLPDLCRTIKAMGFAVKLDSNGSRPTVLKQLVAEPLIDYIAMDIKTAPERYSPFICRSCNPADITESIRIILTSQLPHEFRTTCVSPIVDEEAIAAMATLINGARRHALQKVQYDTVDVLHPEFFQTHDWYIDESTLKRYQSLIADHVGTCVIR